MTASSPDHPRPAAIQVAAAGNGSRRTIASTFQGMQGKRLILQATERLAISTAVSVEYEDALFLGEVIACAASGNTVWNMEIKVEQILTGLQSLVALRDRLLGEGMPKALELLPVGHRN